MFVFWGVIIMKWAFPYLGYNFCVVVLLNQAATVPRVMALRVMHDT